MKVFRKRQKRFKIITNSVVILTAVYMLVYIGIQPYLTDAAATCCRIAADILVIASLILLFYYISKFAKADKFLENVEYAITDAGYYLTARADKTSEAYRETVSKDLAEQGYRIKNNVVSDEHTFSVRGFKSREYFYIAETDMLDGEKLMAYLNAAIYDCLVVNLKQKGNGVVLYLCNMAEESAIALSKDISLHGRKDALKFAVAIAELSTGRVYFLGNKPTKCQQMIANYVMNCDLPIKEPFIGKETLPFQKELEADMQNFDTKSVF